MAPRQAHPPSHTHRPTKIVSPSEAQKLLSVYLSQSESTPHLHPDSTLSRTGVLFSATSGPTGGLAMHHLRRIEAGLRGENLGIESEEELLGKFGNLQPEGDDERLDEVIANSTNKRRRKNGSRLEEGEIERWSDGVVPHQEIESFANTPMYTPMHEEDGGMEGWQDREEYEQEQGILEGEVGEREGAPNVRQNGVVPEVVEEGAGKGEKDKEERKRRKKEKRMEERRNKAKKAESGG